MTKIVEFIGAGRSIMNYRHWEGAEVWALNLVCFALDHSDVWWVMDDFRYCNNNSLETLIRHVASFNKHVISSRAYPEYPFIEEFNLQETLDYFSPDCHWFNHTPSYMWARAIMYGYDEIHLHGFDYLGEFVRNNQYKNFLHWKSIAENYGIVVRQNPASKLMRELYMHKFPEVDKWNYKDDWPLGGDFYGYYPQPTVRREYDENNLSKWPTP